MCVVEFPVLNHGGETGGGGSSEVVTTTSGDVIIQHKWTQPRFIKSVTVSFSGKDYRVTLYRYGNREDRLPIQSKVSDNKVCHFFFPNGLFMGRGLEVLCHEVESGEKITLNFEGVSVRTGRLYL